MADTNGWVKLTEENPDHSLWYINRFKQMAEEGRDLAGESRLVDALTKRESRILDAGCGPGRVGAQLAALGHDVVGVDIDPVLIDEARRAHPGSTWHAGDLAVLSLMTFSPPELPFDCIVSAGNVMTFLAKDTRVEVLRRLKAHLAEDGRLVVGFGANRGYTFDDFFSDSHAAGLESELRCSTWDMRPLDSDADFLVAVLRAAH